MAYEDYETDTVEEDGADAEGFDEDVEDEEGEPDIPSMDDEDDE